MYLFFFNFDSNQSYRENLGGRKRFLRKYFFFKKRNKKRRLFNKCETLAYKRITSSVNLKKRYYLNTSVHVTILTVSFFLDYYNNEEAFNKNKLDT